MNLPDSPLAPTLTLGPEMSIAHATAWHEALAQALSDGTGDLSLDLAQVTDFDSSGVQLLLAAKRSLADRGDALHIAAASATVRDALGTFGLLDLLDTLPA
jgi:anti-sigma B factor antagonist